MVKQRENLLLDQGGVTGSFDMSVEVRKNEYLKFDRLPICGHTGQVREILKIHRPWVFKC